MSTPTKIEAVIWDLGGVIVRTEDMEPRNTLAKRLDLSREEIERLVFEADEGFSAQLGEIDGEDHMRAVSHKLGLSLGELRLQFFGGDRVDQELVSFIRALRPGRKTALLSNALSNLRAFLTDQWKISDAFDLIVVSAEEGILKPDPAIYQLTLSRLGVIAADAVFIDDVAINVEAAVDVGMQGILFKSREQALGELRPLLVGE
ncbi:MAG: HAD family phosphatase [Anaerolineales bacterium]